MNDYIMQGVKNQKVKIIRGCHFGDLDSVAADRNKL